YVDLSLDDARSGETARQVDDDALDLLAGHFLGGMDGAADGIPDCLEIDDRAAADAARDLVADTEDAGPRLDPRDKAAHLGRADVERRDQAAARRHRATPRRSGVTVDGGRRPLAHVGFPAFLTGAACDAGGALTRSTRRLGNRKSTVCTSRFRSAFARSSSASRLHAAVAPSSGSNT